MGEVLKFGLMLFLLFAFIITDVILGVVIFVQGVNWVPKPNVLPMVSGMNVYDHASLFPFNGNPSSTTPGANLATCVQSCAIDTTCQGFNFSTDSSNNTSCAFFKAPNVVGMLGTGVNVDAYFNNPARFVIGRNTPGQSEQVYMKPTATVSLFPSGYEQPWIALTENC